MTRERESSSHNPKEGKREWPEVGRAGLRSQERRDLSPLLERSSGKSGGTMSSILLAQCGKKRGKNFIHPYTRGGGRNGSGGSATIGRRFASMREVGERGLKIKGKGRKKESQSISRGGEKEKRIQVKI